MSLKKSAHWFYVGEVVWFDHRRLRRSLISVNKPLVQPLWESIEDENFCLHITPLYTLIKTVKGILSSLDNSIIDR